MAELLGHDASGAPLYAPATTVPVPVSLIERVAGELWEDSADRAELLALLSQPTPTTEPEESGVCHCGASMSDHSAWDNHSPVDMSYPTNEAKFREQYVHVPDGWRTPPSIADMVPGTTFRDENESWVVLHDGLVVCEHGGYRNLTNIDPSTIRDVTPPTN